MLHCVHQLVTAASLWVFAALFFCCLAVCCISSTETELNLARQLYKKLKLTSTFDTLVIHKNMDHDYTIWEPFPLWMFCDENASELFSEEAAKIKPQERITTVFQWISWEYAFFKVLIFTVAQRDEPCSHRSSRLHTEYKWDKAPKKLVMTAIFWTQTKEELKPLNYSIMTNACKRNWVAKQKDLMRLCYP